MIAVHRDLRFLIPDVAVALSFKRLIDVIGASVVFFLTLPIWIVVSLLIKITSHGPIFFQQRRVGLNGSTFTCLKFRTMC
ncbi:MAG TPA: sugar transferase, partial [Alphaproteobacteria bacterium]|nr:sugar transferase [Alphaproteobacteria bacterium]